MQIIRIPQGEPFFRVAVCMCFVGNKTDVLILKRRNDHPIYPGLWGFPAGKLRSDERTFAQAAVREIKEETGNVVSIDKLRPLDTRAFKHFKLNGKPFYFIARSFVVDSILPGFRRNPAEHAAAVITSAKEVVAMKPKFFIPDAHEVFLSHYHKLLVPTVIERQAELVAPLI